VGLGGALHLSLGVLRVARLGANLSQLFVRQGMLAALVDTLSLRVNSQGIKPLLRLYQGSVKAPLRLY
jgi:hypothetical protein